MKEPEKILSQLPGHDGMTVPEGYFADFQRRMSESLPEREPRVVEMPRTLWQKVRPYVYLAAMFAGIWCMLQMFAMMGTASTGLTPESSPVLAEAISSDEFMDDYYYMSVNEMDLYDDLYAQGLDVTGF